MNEHLMITFASSDWIWYTDGGTEMGRGLSHVCVPLWGELEMWWLMSLKDWQQVKRGIVSFGEEVNYLMAANGSVCFCVPLAWLQRVGRTPWGVGSCALHRLDMCSVNLSVDGCGDPAWVGMWVMAWYCLRVQQRQWIVSASKCRQYACIMMAARWWYLLSSCCSLFGQLNLHSLLTYM